MDVWIEAVMAPFLLILPLLASLRYLIHPIGKRCSSSTSVRRKNATASRKSERVVQLESLAFRKPLRKYRVSSTWESIDTLNKLLWLTIVLARIARVRNRQVRMLLKNEYVNYSFTIFLKIANSTRFIIYWYIITDSFLRYYDSLYFRTLDYVTIEINIVSVLVNHPEIIFNNLSIYAKSYITTYIWS